MTAQPRYATSPDPTRATRLDEIVELAKTLDAELMPWQEELFKVALEINDEGNFAYRNAVVTVPRQAGKSFALMLRAALTATTVKRATVVYAAQSGSMARLRIREWGPILIDAGLATGMSLTNGSEHIKFPNGSRILAVASSPTAGHGLTCDLILADECMSWKADDRLRQALVPTTATKRNAQLWYVSTVGDASSVIFHEMIDDCRQQLSAGTSTRTAYVEYSAPPGLDVTDRSTWESFHPAVGLTIDEDVIADALQSLPFPEFLRAYCNIPTIANSSLFPPGSWAACATTEKLPTTSFHLAIDSFEGESSIALAAGDMAIVLDSRPGTAWVVDRAVELCQKYNPWTISIDGGSQTRILLPKLEERLGSSAITVLATADITDAAALLLADVVEGRFRHGNQPIVNDAAAAAVRRPVGDRWALGRKKSAGPITSLVALALSHWQAVQRSGGDLRIW